MATRERVRRSVAQGTELVAGSIAGTCEGIKQGLDGAIGKGKATALLMLVGLGILAILARPAVPQTITQVAVRLAAHTPYPISTAVPKWVLNEVEPPYKELFVKAGKEYDIPWQILAGLAKEESAFNPKAVSSDGYGSRGLCQFIPSTWREVTKEWKWSWDDAFDPYKSTELCT